MGQAPKGDTYNTDGEGYPLIAGAGDFDKKGGISVSKFTTAPTRLSEPGDIIMSIRASIGATVWADKVYCLGRGVAGLKPGPELDSQFLWYWLPTVEKLLLSKARGATFVQVNRKDVEELPIELPSLDEQRKFAEEQHLKFLIQQKRERQQELFEELERSRFIEKYGNPITNPKNLPMVRLSDIATITTGNSPSRSNKENFGHHIEWIKSNNLGPKYATNASEYLSEVGAKKARIAPSGSILVTCIAGSPSSIGKCSIVDRDVAFNQQINSITPHNKNDLEFIWRQLRLFPELVQIKSTGGMKGLVSKTEFSNILILSTEGK